jgi:hypothetical protein
MTPHGIDNRRNEFWDRAQSSWKRLANALGIPDADRAGWPPGDEPDRIWHWLKERGALSSLVPALIVIGRSDLAKLLQEPEEQLILIDGQAYPSLHISVRPRNATVRQPIPSALPALTKEQLIAACAKAAAWKKLHHLAERAYTYLRRLYVSMVRCRLGEWDDGRNGLIEQHQPDIDTLRAFFKLLQLLNEELDPQTLLDPLLGLHFCLDVIQDCLLWPSSSIVFSNAMTLLNRLSELMLSALSSADSVLQCYFDSKTKA